MSGNVEYDMVYINCGNVFGVSQDTTASFVGAISLNGTTLNSFSVTAAGGGGFYVNGMGTLKGTSFTFSISKYSSIRVNNVGLLLLSDYSVFFDGSTFRWN